MTPLGVSHALEMHEYPMDETPIKRKMKLRTLRKFGDWSLDAPTITITGNNRSAVLSSAARTRRLGGYWHQSPMTSNHHEIIGRCKLAEYSITLDRIERRRGKV